MIIRNKKTGEMKVVNDAELGNYGLSAPAQSAGQSATINPGGPEKWLEDTIRGNALPSIGAGIGGTTGAMIGAGAGGFPAFATGPAGAAIGYGGGEAIKRTLANLFGYGGAGTDAPSQELLSGITTEPLNAAANQAIMQLIGKGAGILKRPMGTATDFITKRLANSPMKVDMSKIASLFLKEAEPLMNDPTFGHLYTPAAQQTATKLYDAANLGQQVVPIAKANVQRMTSGRLGYGAGDSVLKDLAQIVNRLLQKDIVGQEPIAGPVLGVEHLLKEAGNVSQNLPWGFGRAATAIGKLLQPAGKAMFSGLEFATKNPAVSQLAKTTLGKPEGLLRLLQPAARTAILSLLSQ